ncbi:MAG: ASCH domain-containing protein [Prevotellaceae bacterium]|jgi:ASC-1-like (ASCH) protein|nr:ASCH domain-containing protein [Prevotellaceae bacterium]
MKKDMKILTLSIKQKYFDEILAGTKKVETREITPLNSHKYGVYVIYEGDKAVAELKTTKELEEYGSESTAEEFVFEFVPKKYDALKLITGAYNLPKRPYMIVEVKDENLFWEADEDGNQITYELNNITYVMTIIDYTLGKVLEVQLYK